MTTLQVYMAAYSCELSILAALLVGVGIGFLVGHVFGDEDGYRRGAAEGFRWGKEFGEEHKYKRNAKGQFTK